MNPAETLRQRQLKQISEARRCVALLATLDFVNANPEYLALKATKLLPYKADITRARAAREALRKQREAQGLRWLNGTEEYDSIELHLIECLGPAMSQSEYQALEATYLEQKKLESIERWRKLPVIVLQGGSPP